MATATMPVTSSNNTMAYSEGEEFVIGLPSNPSTGYSWKAYFNEQNILLVEQWYIPDNLGIPGSPGIQCFKFGIVKSGTITMEYKRSWVAEPVATMEFKVKVK